MVRQAQKVDRLRQPEGVLGEGSLCRSEEENGGGWFSRIAAFFKSLGRPRVDNQVGQEVVRDGGAVPSKKSNTGTKTAEYAATTRAKRAGKARGKQFVPQPTKIKQKVKPYRKVK